MSHFAELDENNVVIRVLVGDNNMPNEGYDWFVENLGGRWVQTSYNHNFRKRFAAMGMIYDERLDAFIYRQPYPSWTLNEDTCEWEPPTPIPANRDNYRWDEATLSWIPIS